MALARAQAGVRRGNGWGIANGPSYFFFTDIESSTRLWDQHPDSIRKAAARLVEEVSEPPSQARKRAASNRPAAKKKRSTAKKRSAAKRTATRWR